MSPTILMTLLVISEASKELDMSHEPSTILSISILTSCTAEFLLHKAFGRANN